MISFNSIQISQLCPAIIHASAQKCSTSCRLERNRRGREVEESDKKGGNGAIRQEEEKLSGGGGGDGVK